MGMRELVIVCISNIVQRDFGWGVEKKNKEARRNKRK